LLEGEPWPLSAGLWALTALAIGGGPWPELGEAKSAARVPSESAAALAQKAAGARAGTLGLRPELERALIAFGTAVEADVSRK
jgi:hypothetical protein